MTLLSIIIPVYNSKQTIGRTIESLKKISGGSKELVEVIIIDDGSMDESIQIVKAKINELLPLKINLIGQENQGTAKARNAGLNYCTGQWIFFLDADDELAFDPIPYIMESPHSTSVAFSVKLYKNLKPYSKLSPVPITLNNHLDIFTTRNAITVSNIIFRKGSLQYQFETNFFYLEDWLFWIMNPYIFEQMKIFPDKISAIIHFHEGNKTNNSILQAQYREKFANTVLCILREKLTKKQMNNLIIQSQIALIQQGKKMTMKTFFCLPCNMVLYCKLLIFSLLRSNTMRYDFYRNK